MLRLLLLYLTLGWVCVLGVTEEDQDVQESLAPQGWASSWSRSNSPLERPRRRQDQTLPYASWESPLLVKESLTSEEKSWLPQKDPLEIIKEGYTSGSRMFDYNFEQSPALVLKTVGDYNVGAAALSHAGAPHRPSLGDNLSRNFNSSPQPGRPRKYYLTGVMQELPRDSGYANKHLRKYFLQADTKAMTANKDQPRVVFSDVEDSIHLIQVLGTNDPLPSSHDTAEPAATPEPPATLDTTNNPHDIHTSAFSPYFPPTVFRHPTSYPVAPPNTRSPSTYYLQQPTSQHPTPLPFRKYYLLPRSHQPTTAADGNGLQDSQEGSISNSRELSSFEVYEMLRQPLKCHPESC